MLRQIFSEDHILVSGLDKSAVMTAKHFLKHFLKTALHFVFADLKPQQEESGQSNVESSQTFMCTHI